MKILKLSVKERLIFQEILPENGRKVEMILCNDLLNKIEFTADEVSRLKLRDVGNGVVNWDVSAETLLEVELTPEQVDLLQRGSAKMDENGKVTRYNVGLLQKIDEL